MMMSAIVREQLDLQFLLKRRTAKYLPMGVFILFVTLSDFDKEETKEWLFFA